MSATQQVITIDDISSDNAPAIYVAGGLDKFFTIVEKEVTGEVPDLSTAKGRARIASLAAKVSSSKVAVEKPGRDYLKKLKEMPKVIELELAAWVKKMDTLRDTTRKPLTDWESAEVARRDQHIDAVQAIHDFCLDLTDVNAAVLSESIASVEAIQMGSQWEEFAEDAALTKDSTLTKLRATLISRQKHEAELAEIARFNAEKVEREQQERDAAIARAAVEQAQREAAAAAQAERDAAAKREQALIDQAAQAQRDADQKAREAESAAANQALQLKLQAEQAERQAIQAKADQLAAEQRAAQQKADDERRHAEAAQRAEQDRLVAIQRQAAAVEQARLDQIAKHNAAADEIIRQQDAREADKAHKAKINRAALDAFVAGGMTEGAAKQAVILIATRVIPGVTIAY
jgi:hypothetical protein